MVQMVRVIGAIFDIIFDDTLPPILNVKAEDILLQQLTVEQLAHNLKNKMIDTLIQYVADQKSKGKMS